MRREKRRRSRGFSLPEIMLALAVMAACVGIFAACFPSAGQAISRSKHQDIASDQCQQQLDFYRDVGYSSLPAIASGQSGISVAFTPTTELPGATGTVTFTRVDASFAATTSATGRVTAVASVSWSGSGTDHGTRLVTTLITQ